MNLGNKLAVGEAVDTGIDAINEVAAPEITVPEPDRPAPVVATAPEEPVTAHAER